MSLLLKDQPADEVRFVEATAHYFGRTVDIDEQRARNELNELDARLEREAIEAIDAAPPHVAIRAEPVVEFDAATHTYTRNGVVLPSVTKIIKAILPSQFHIDEWYLTRGTATHLACELLDQGRLDWSTVDERILPRVQAYAEWARGREIVAIEKRLASKELHYAGTLDRMVRDYGELILADMKNSFYPQCWIQLGAYSLLWKENYGEKVNRALVVELKENGKAREHWLNSKELREAERQWLAVLTTYEFATTYKILAA